MFDFRLQVFHTVAKRLNFTKAAEELFITQPMIASTYIPAVQHYNVYLVNIAKAGLTVTLFLIGCGLSRKVLKSVGFKPLIQGVVLWVLISVAALWAVTSLAH